MELVQQRTEKLKKGKAAGINKLTTQHINLAHPLLVVHLSMSFQIMLTHSVVLFFFEFGLGIVIPLVKNTDVPSVL